MRSILINPTFNNPNSYSGADERQRDRVRRRRSLLPGVQCHSLYSERRECASLDASPCTDHPTEYHGHKTTSRNLKRKDDSLWHHAGRLIGSWIEQVVLLKLNSDFQASLDEATEAWGIKVERVEM